MDNLAFAVALKYLQAVQLFIKARSVQLSNLENITFTVMCSFYHPELLWESSML